MADSGQHGHLANRLADLRRLGKRTRAAHPVAVLVRDGNEPTDEEAAEAPSNQPVAVAQPPIALDRAATLALVEAALTRLSAPIVARASGLEEAIRQDAENSLNEYRASRDQVLQEIGRLSPPPAAGRGSR